MVTAFSGAKRWFRPDGEVEFHVCTDADPVSPCGRRLRHNVDSVRDYEPDKDVCAHCHAVANDLPVPGSEPVVVARKQATTKAATTRKATTKAATTRKPRSTKKPAVKK